MSNNPDVKPVKAWAIVDEKGVVCLSDMSWTKAWAKFRISELGKGYRIIPVMITPL